MRRPVKDECEVLYVNRKTVRDIGARMPSHEVVSVMAETFGLLADPTRLRIVQALSRGELCVCDLAAMLGAGRTSVSNHLRLLRSMRLVRHRRDGKLAYYSLSDSHIAALLKECLEHVIEL
ncbi:MAG: helix-turn-helix transcriptional regulator [Nitrospinae bacterium]|nr:helix-turn-helix transcriptional regulator [Nitrospinota bacterium]